MPPHRDNAPAGRIFQKWAGTLAALGCACAGALLCGWPVWRGGVQAGLLCYADSGLPMLSTPDAYFFLARAREMLEHGVEADSLSALSVLLAFFSRITGSNLELMAFWTAPVLAVACGLCAAAWGRLAGLSTAATALTAACVTCAPCWQQRVQPAMCDTDALVFFFWNFTLYWTARLSLPREKLNASTETACVAVHEKFYVPSTVSGLPASAAGFGTAAGTEILRASMADPCGAGGAAWGGGCRWARCLWLLCAVSLGWIWYPAVVLPVYCLWAWGLGWRGDKSRAGRRVRRGCAWLPVWALCIGALLSLLPWSAEAVRFKQLWQDSWAMLWQQEVLFASVMELAPFSLPEWLAALGGHWAVGVLLLGGVGVLWHTRPYLRVFLAPSLGLLALGLVARRFTFMGLLPVALGVGLLADGAARRCAEWLAEWRRTGCSLQLMQAVRDELAEWHRTGCVPQPDVAQRACWERACACAEGANNGFRTTDFLYETRQRQPLQAGYFQKMGLLAKLCALNWACAALACCAVPAVQACTVLHTPAMAFVDAATDRVALVLAEQAKRAAACGPVGLMHWWDEGEYLCWRTGLPAFWDSGAQRPLTAFLAARPLCMVRPEMARHWIRFFALHGGNEGGDAWQTLVQAWGDADRAQNELTALFRLPVGERAAHLADWPELRVLVRPAARFPATARPRLTRGLPAGHEYVLRTVEEKAAWLFPQGTVFLFLRACMLDSASWWMALGQQRQADMADVRLHVKLFPRAAIRITPEGQPRLPAEQEARGERIGSWCAPSPAQPFTRPWGAGMEEPVLIIPQGMPRACLADALTARTLGFRLLAPSYENLEGFIPLSRTASAALWEVRD